MKPKPKEPKTRNDGHEPSIFMAGYTSNASSAKLPYTTSFASRTSVQKNKIDSSGINGELENIKKGVSPMQAGQEGSISVADVIELCQKAYWNVAIFRSTIDIQTEFANSKLSFRSPNKTVEKFYTAWYDKIGGPMLAEQTFREWFRSGNVFLLRFDGEIEYSEYRKITRAADKSLIKKVIPLRYILLNPKDIRCCGASSFIDAEYAKVLNDYELNRYKSPNLTPAEQEFLDTLPADVRKAIKNGQRPLIKLDADKLTALFCSKQDYEAMAVPMYYPVLCDINLKLEFKKAEQVIARTVDYAVLLVTAGDEERGDMGNEDIRKALVELFASESVGRVLISDWTTKADFIIPDLNKIFGAEKYKVVNEDIANGLMNIFWGEEKFANSMVKIQVFLERLNQAREAYINQFLKPEMKRIAETLGFNTIPEVEFSTINLKDEVEYMKIYIRLAELGLLSPQELFTALQVQQLPLKEDSVISQKEFKTQKDNGLYEPLLNKKVDEAPAGRPAGTKAPKKQGSKVGPIGTGSKASFSVSKIKDTVEQLTVLSLAVEEIYKQKNQIQRLSKKHKDICWHVAESIAINEPMEQWAGHISSYIDNPKIQGDRTDDAMSISVAHSVSPIVGAILLNAVTNEDENV